jgi:catechol 2,3-dioxygenase-like lactoylglutathione lyase family enzyme
MATSVQVVFDCADPDRMARFWATALGYELPGPPDGHATWEDWLRAQGVPEEDWNSASAVEDPDGVGPRVFFQRVPESKVVKNRVHLDLNVGGGRDTPLEERQRRVDAETVRLVAAGARKVGTGGDFGGYHVNMLDPEDNEFDLQ